MMLTTKSVLDRVFTRIKDNSGTLRVKMLGWLNSAMQDAWAERSWLFLEKKVDIAIVSNAITLPADFGDEVFISIGGIYIFTVADRLSPSEAAYADERGGDPYGYTKDSDTLVFHPSADGTATLTYTAQVPDAGYVDDTTETIFPLEFLPLFERVLLSAFYEYDVDADRLPVGLKMDADQLRRLKKLDNRRKPLPQLNRFGMVRE